MELPSGEVETFYVQLPQAVKASFTFEVATKEGAEDVAGLVERYLNEMARLINQARERFDT